MVYAKITKKNQPTQKNFITIMVKTYFFILTVLVKI